jgi:uncharacterized protein (TIGR03435 family)
MMRTNWGVSLILWTVCGAFGQTSTVRPEFEVASVKPAQPSADGRVRVQMGGDPGMDRMSNVTLRDYLRAAYGVKDFQISGPDWLNSERFDIMAKMPPDTSREQLQLMRQKLLEDRFKLVLHREKKTVPVYALVAGKGGLKIQPVAEEGADDPKRGGMMRIGPGHLEAQKVPLAGLADRLSMMVDRPVLDMTEIKGRFDITLDFAPDETQMTAIKGKVRLEGGGEGTAGSDDHDRPSIFAALQDKLGLKLEARKEPMDMLVIDHAERVPVEN